jgi:hypothetical protein
MSRKEEFDPSTTHVRAATTQMSALTPLPKGSMRFAAWPNATQCRQDRKRMSACPDSLLWAGMSGETPGQW